jgi:hypothetical protein
VELALAILQWSFKLLEGDMLAPGSVLVCTQLISRELLKRGISSPLPLLAVGLQVDPPSCVKELRESKGRRTVSNSFTGTLPRKSFG